MRIGCCASVSAVRGRSVPRRRPARLSCVRFDADPDAGQWAVVPTYTRSVDFGCRTTRCPADFVRRLTLMATRMRLSCSGPVVGDCSRSGMTGTGRNGSNTGRSRCRVQPFRVKTGSAPGDALRCGGQAARTALISTISSSSVSAVFGSRFQPSVTAWRLPPRKRSARSVSEMSVTR